MSQVLSQKKCRPCEGGVEALNATQANLLFQDLSGPWSLADNHRTLTCQYSFTSFLSGMTFCQAVAWLAEQENHHPDLLIQYNQVTLTLSTHAIGGLSENDFILAAKIDQLILDQIGS